MTTPTINEQDIRATYKLLNHTNETELRFIKNKLVVSRFVSNQKEFLDACKEYNGSVNCYVGVNERTHEGSKDTDVTAITLIPFDFDVKRPVNAAATKEQIQEALEYAETVKKRFDEQGFNPSVMFTGNGFAVWCRIPATANTPEFAEKVKTLQHEIKKRFDTDLIRVDNVGNASRIMRLAGTINLKCNRPAHWVYYNENESQALLDYINTQLKTTTNSEPLNERLRPDYKADFHKFLEQDAALSEIYYGTKNFDSTSERDLAICQKLAFYGFSFGEIDSIISGCAASRWKSKRKEYKQETYQRGKNFADENTQPKKRIELKPIKEILEVEDEETQWIVEPIVPKSSLTILAAKRATFKTSLAIITAIKASRGEKVFGKFTTTKTNALLLDGESGQRVLQNYLKRLGAETTDSFYVTDLATINLRDDVTVLELIGIVKKYDIGLLIIDSLRRALRGDENDSANLSWFLTNIRRIANESGAGVILIHHERKSMQGFKQESDYFDQMDSIRGSGDISAAADMILQLKRQGKADLVEMHITKSRFGKEGQPYTLTKTTHNGIEDFVATEGTIDESDAMKKEVLLWLWERETNKTTTKELKEKWSEPFSATTVDRLIRKLKEDGIFQAAGKTGKHSVDLDSVKDYLVSVGSLLEDEGQRRIEP